MEKQLQRLIPLGSIVTLKGGSKKIMIIGRYQKAKDSQKDYDYAAVYYPEGMIDNQQFFLFQHQDIETIYFVGYQDLEEVDFLNKVANYLNK